VRKEQEVKVNSKGGGRLRPPFLPTIHHSLPLQFTVQHPLANPKHLIMGGGGGRELYEVLPRGKE